MPAERVGELLRVTRRLGFSGVNVTHPCKRTVVEHLTELSPDAATLGAVNTVVFDRGRAVGHNTDWPGFQESFTRGLPGVETSRVVLLGAGGAGAARRPRRVVAGRRATRPSSTPQPGRADALAKSLCRRYGRPGGGV